MHKNSKWLVQICFLLRSILPTLRVAPGAHAPLPLVMPLIRLLPMERGRGKGKWIVGLLAKAPILHKSILHYCQGAVITETSTQQEINIRLNFVGSQIFMMKTIKVATCIWFFSYRTNKFIEYIVANLPNLLGKRHPTSKSQGCRFTCLVGTHTKRCHRKWTKMTFVCSLVKKRLYVFAGLSFLYT